MQDEDVESTSSPVPRAGLWARCRHLGLILSRGILFIVFGIGAVLIAYLGFPLIFLQYGRGDRAERMTQRLVQRSISHYLRFAEIIRGFRVTFHHPERLLAEGGNLIVANHPSLLDVVILISKLPQADCVVKHGAWRNPFLRGVVKAARYIPNDGGISLVDACAKRLNAGNTLVIFPEGTRSPRGRLGEFSRGVAHIALASGCRVTPVTITCTPPALRKGQPWYSEANRMLEYTVTVEDSFDTSQFIEADLSAVVAARRLTAELHSFFQMRLEHGHQ